LTTVNRKNVGEDKGERELYFPEFSPVQTNWIMSCLFNRFLIRPWKKSCMIVYSTSSARRYISLRDYNLQLQLQFTIHCVCLRLISFGYPSCRGICQDTKKETHLIWVSTYISTKVLIEDPIRVIFVWPWKMVSVSVRYLFYQPMDEKIKTWPLRFPAKVNPNMEKSLFDWPIVL